MIKRKKWVVLLAAVVVLVAAVVAFFLLKDSKEPGIYYKESSWNIAEDYVNGTVQKDKTYTMTDGTVAFSFGQQCKVSAATLVTEGAADWSNYTFGADVKMSPYSDGKYSAIAVAGYVRGGDMNSQSYQVRITPSDKGYDVTLFKYYLDDTGSSERKSMASSTLETAIANYGGEVAFHVDLVLYGSTVTVKIDNVTALYYETQSEWVNGYGTSYTGGSVGIAALRSSNADSAAVYKASFSNLCVEPITEELPAGSGEVNIELDSMYNTTVVEEPDVFTDDFEDNTAAEVPDYWLQNNEEKTWFVQKLSGNKVYGVDNTETVSHTWVHVFETNVDYTADLYVPADGVTDTSKVGLTVRHNGLVTVAWVQVGYDFAQQKWYIFDDKGYDFPDQTIWAEETSEFTTDQWHTIRVRAVGNGVWVYCDDALVLATSAVQHITTGRVGLYTENTEVYADNVRLELLSGQGRVEAAALENYVLSRESYTEGSSIFVYSDDFWILNYLGELFISEDRGTSFRPATDDEMVTYAFFAQSNRTQYIRLHNGYILKVDNYTGGKSYLSKDNGATFEQVGMLFDKDDLPISNYYGGMNDMVKEVNIGDNDGDGVDEYRVFYCADCRAYGNPQGTGSISYHWEEVYYTDDFGYTWNKCELDTRAISSLSHVCESRILGCSDGTLRMYCSWNTMDCMSYYVSYDDGVTWEGEYAIPQISCSRGSFQYTQDSDGTYYMVCVYTQPAGTGNTLPRCRLSLFRSYDGKEWEYLLDCWRWEDVPGDEYGTINQSVDPSITVTDEYVIVTGGWGEIYGSGHNLLRQHILKLDKDLLTAYEEWPNYDEYTDPDDILYIEVGSMKETHVVGGELDLTDAYLIVHHLDGSTTQVAMADETVTIEEVVIDQWHTTDMPEPDMSVAGEKLLRISYKNIACNFTIQVVEEAAN